MVKKILLQHVALIVVALSWTALFAQTPTPIPPVTPPLRKVNYSESVPFEPRVFIPAPNPKDKKKPKDEKPKPTPSPSPPNKIANADGLLSIPVSVFAPNDGVLKGLSKADLKVFIGDEEQMITSVETEKPLHVVLSVDVSPSTENRIKVIRNVATNSLKILGPTTRS